MSRRSQAGFTLVEMMIASAMGAIVMGALSSVVWLATSSNASVDPRLQASGQVRNLQTALNADLTSARPAPLADSGCTQSVPCTTFPIQVRGPIVPARTGLAQPDPVAHYVTYCYIPAGSVVERFAGTLTACPGAAGSGQAVARRLSSFSWYYTGTSVVVSVSATVGSYSTGQVLLFNPGDNLP